MIFFFFFDIIVFLLFLLIFPSLGSFGILGRVYGVWEFGLV